MSYMRPTGDELAEYLGETYGLCEVTRIGRTCRCLRPGPWLGLACPNWRPAARDCPELAEMQRRTNGR